jgi:peptide-methionine (R)-S-oxide reductase
MKIIRTDAEWREILSDEVYQVTRNHGTERAFTSPLNNENRDGLWHCACCDTPLFDSSAKFTSGTGWPSFFQPISPEIIEERADTSFFMQRIEACCAICDAHLGHIFNDGPQPTGLRYCLNGVAFNFKPNS